ncbi:MAG: right-handed parallel beta-helix repeat-containing protein [Candidatus Methylarchaceae archaeon HK02M2]|nr:right-handed parallel beta-helix repeat-containing protein [Candidatus Methylarchaceae archaeon HK02M2]
MKKLAGTLTIALLLIMPLLLVIPLPVVAEPTKDLSSAIGGGTGGEFHLDPSVLYTTDSDIMITGDTHIYGNGARIDLDDNSIIITGAYLYIERCNIANGDYSLDFEDGASGFVYNNVIADDNSYAIYIYECSDITIKENSIIHSDNYGIYIEDSTDITILENTIFRTVDSSYGEGIYVDNENLYNDDLDAREEGEDLPLHNIIIKGNKIANCYSAGIYLYYVNGVYISSNLIISNDSYGIYLEYCPIVSITNNKILDNADSPIYLDGDLGWDPETDDVRTSATVSNNKIMGNDGYAIYGWYYQNVVITYNEIAGNEYGIDIYGYDETFLMEPILIAYNVITGATDEEAIYLDGEVSDVSILYNKIEGNYGGIYIDGSDLCEGLLIKGNVITGSIEDYALEVTDYDAPITIEWNTILSNYYGVYLFDLENPQILHNTIMYTCYDDEGLELGDNDDDDGGGLIAYNTIAYNEDSNLYLGYYLKDVIIEYNTITGADDYNIEVINSEDITLQYNSIWDSVEYGIYWSSSSGLIHGNTIGHSGHWPLSGAGEYGIELSNADATTISGNTIWGNYYGIYLSNSGDPASEPVDIIRNYIAHNVYGIYLSGESDPTIGGTYDNRNYIIRNFEDGVHINSDDADPTITYNNIFENYLFGVYTETQTADIDAENNFWGDISGPGDPATFGEGPGIGDEVSDDIDYTPWEVVVIP